MARRRTAGQQRAMEIARAHAELKAIKDFLATWANGTDSIQRLVGSFALTGIRAREHGVLRGQETMDDLLRHIRDEMPTDLENALCRYITEVVADLRKSLR